MKLAVSILGGMALAAAVALAQASDGASSQPAPDSRPQAANGQTVTPALAAEAAPKPRPRKNRKVTPNMSIRLESGFGGACVRCGRG